MSYLMGIDIGSTNLKAVVYDYNGNFISKGCTPNEVVHLDKEHPQWAFWDPDKLWFGIADAIMQAVSKISDVNLIKAVSVIPMGMDGLPVEMSLPFGEPSFTRDCKRPFR